MDIEKFIEFQKFIDIIKEVAEVDEDKAIEIHHMLMTDEIKRLERGQYQI